MKVLFAVSNENISDSIVKKYQKDYKEIITYKNVYYFNAILKEIQRDKNYDRIVISEDLEPFASNDYEAIDRFIFEKLDSISDEATDSEGGDTPIILICSDRRSKSEQLLVKLFSIGVYSALLGQDRSIGEVCKLIRKPRTKKEAKIYYKIDSEDANYQEENEDSVSEVEIQNIRAHYKKLGKNEEAYVESFNNIASQYTDAQLRVIVKCLPLNVKAVLEAKSPKYQSIMAFSGEPIEKNIKREDKKEDALKINFIENQLNKPKMTKPVIVPSAVNTNKVTKLNKTQENTLENNKNDTTIDTAINIATEKKSEEVSLQDMLNEESVEEKTIEQPKRGRGRPKKVVTEEPVENKTATPKRGRGRPKKVTTEEPVENKIATPKRGRGRPKKVAEVPQQQEPIEENLNLFDLDSEKNENDEPVVEEKINTILPGFDQQEESQVTPEVEQEEVSAVLPGFENDNISINNASYEQPTPNFYNNSNVTMLQNQSGSNIDIASLLTKEKKIVSFVGTTKNGTSFLINNLAELFSSMGISTAILDVTKNKNSYYIYTKNEEQLRNVAMHCMENLENGIAGGIKVNENLTVYTSIPKEESRDCGEILKTLIKNYSLVLVDCDFDTDISYFENAQEIYLVQSMDILTIQPLTAFLRDLKAKNIIIPEKIRIVINKETRIHTLTPKVIIGGMSYYNDPSMSFMTELFNKDNVKYCTIPFDEQVYSKYLEGLVNCKISLNGYSKNFMSVLKELGNMVYPLLNNKYKPVANYGRSNKF